VGSQGVKASIPANLRRSMNSMCPWLLRLSSMAHDDVSKLQASLADAILAAKSSKLQNLEPENPP